MKQIGSIQILRALAALMVVFGHAQDDALNEAFKAGIAFAQDHALPWVSGVDLFFVISGFIMVHASERLFASRGAARSFLSRRVIRIVPLYWLATTIVLAILGVLAWRGKPFPSLAEIVTSFGFVPFARPGDQQPRPLAAQGWTLNYEMFFYFVFACFLRLNRVAAVTGTVATLIVLVALGALFEPTQAAFAYWSDPIVLEFALGMGVALAWQHSIRLSRRIAFALIAFGLLVLALDPDGMAQVANFGVDPNGFGRLAACGLPMASIFAGVVLIERPFEMWAPLRQMMASLGDASYALYLFHPFVVILTRKAYLVLGLAEPLGFWPLVLAQLPLAALLALAIHAFVEKPWTARLQKWLKRSLGANRHSSRASDTAIIYWR